jgi:hypothetical protein
MRLGKRESRTHCPACSQREAKDDARKIDLIRARHADAFEIHLVGIERPGGVEPRLGADAVARRRIEPGALAFRHDDQIAIGLEARRHGPFDLRRVMNVDVLVDDDHMLDVVVAGEGTEHDVLGLAIQPLGERLEGFAGEKHARGLET